MKPASHSTYLQVAFATPLRRLFDYIYVPRTGGVPPASGKRIVVPFGKQNRVGIIVNISNQSELPDGKLKEAVRVLDDIPILNTKQQQLASWASHYYHHSIGDILFSMLPLRYRKNNAFVLPEETIWQLSKTGDLTKLKSNAVRQHDCLEVVAKYPDGVNESELLNQGIQRKTLQLLGNRGFLQSRKQLINYSEPHVIECGPKLSLEQEDAVAAMDLAKFHVYLLNGVTGSGKTEVYIRLILTILSAGKQALLLVPEIGLTPQSVARLRRRIKAPVRMLHSGLSDGEQADVWSLASLDEPQVIIATRSGLFAPLPNLGLIIVDEEHDASYKQMSGWQYSARDLAIVRAQQANAPIMLGSATPSLESYYRVKQGQYQELKLTERPGASKPAKYQVLDIRKLPLDQGLSLPLLDKINTHLQRNEQVMLFLNRRGYAPVMMCHDCGWLANCHRCDSTITLHQNKKRLECHHCGAIQPIPQQCPDCHSSNVTPVGQGTERIEEVLQRHFKDYKIARIDRDSTRRKGAMQTYIEAIKANEYQLLVGTQMLAKGHHFPNLSLVVIIDMDAALYCSDFRATERFGQLLKQVSGRAGRADKEGLVVIQSRQPDHPHLQRLITEEYPVFLEQLLTERQQTQWPPATFLALLRAEATREQACIDFLLKITNTLNACAQRNNVALLGPTPAIQHKRAGKYRYHLLVQCSSRPGLHQCLSEMVSQIESEKLAKSVRWTLDVDPLDLV